MRRSPPGWRSTQNLSADGSVDSEQALVAPRRVVSETEAGAALLGIRYWSEVDRFTYGLVRAIPVPAAVQLRLLRRGPVLLRLGGPTVEVGPGSVGCRYAITGGLLARRAGGEVAFFQHANGTVELRSTIRGFFPALAARPGAPRWTGILYSHVQRRLHLAVSRRYFLALMSDSRS